MFRRFRITLIALASVVTATTALGQPLPSITIGKITSQKTCKVYEESAGRSATVITPFTVATADSWRTWLVKDCVSNFPTIRTSLEAALAATGKFVVKPAGKYTLTGVISQVSGDPDAAPDGPRADTTYSVSGTSLYVSMEVLLRDAAGRTVYGGPLTKKIQLGSDIQTLGLHSSSQSGGEGAYTVLQNQVALAVARLVAFHIVPLRVTSVVANQIRLNYGSPLLTLGTIVHVTPPTGLDIVRYAVTSSDPGSAIADQDNQANPVGIAPGITATVVELDDVAANERRIKRVELPGRD
jgi:hypothetical protein